MLKEINETSSVSSVKECTILSVVPEWFSTFRPSVSSFADSLQKITEISFSNKNFVCFVTIIQCFAL